MTNASLVTTFILTGLPHAPELDTFLFGIFLVIYVFTVVGKLLILLVITADPHLHTSMYYFLTILSFVDMWYSTVTLPKMLMTLVSPEGSAISFPAVWPSSTPSTSWAAPSASSTLSCPMTTSWPSVTRSGTPA